MARNIPNGSTATKDFPEPPAVVAPGSSWTVRHEADFTAFSNHDFELIGDPAAYQDIVVDGVKWYGRNTTDAASNKIKVISGTGIEISPDTGTNIQFYIDSDSPPTGGAINAPRVSARIQSDAQALYPSLPIDKAFAVQAIIEPGTQDIAANSDEWGMVLTNAASSTYVTASRQFNSSAFSSVSPTVGSYLKRAVAGSQGTVSAAQSSTHKFFELVYFPGGTVFASTSADTDFVSPLTATTFQKFVTTDPETTSTGSSVPFNRSDMWVAFYIANYGSSTAFKAIVKKFRILTLD